jgi:hypothetical protein
VKLNVETEQTHPHYFVRILKITNMLGKREVPSSNLSLETGFPEVFRGFPQFLQANSMKGHQIRL